MGNILLHNIEGFRPPARVDPTDDYFRQRDANTIVNSIQQSTGYSPFSADDVRQLAESGFQEKRAEQGAAPFVAELLLQLVTAASESDARAIRDDNLGRTALTDLFMGYGVDLDILTRGQPDILSMDTLVYDSPADGFALDYWVTEHPQPKRFWTLDANARYGFVNMSCMGEHVPLEGNGNIAFIPGVEQALRADIRTLVDSSRKR